MEKNLVAEVLEAQLHTLQGKLKTTILKAEELSTRLKATRPLFSGMVSLRYPGPAEIDDENYLKMVSGISKK